MRQRFIISQKAHRDDARTRTQNTQSDARTHEVCGVENEDGPKVEEERESAEILFNSPYPPVVHNLFPWLIEPGENIKLKPRNVVVDKQINGGFQILPLFRTADRAHNIERRSLLHVCVAWRVCGRFFFS